MDKGSANSPAHLWALLEDRIFPAHHFPPAERALYYHLLRHTLLDGSRTVRRTKSDLARSIGVCPTCVRNALRSLSRAGLLRILDRAKSGLLLEVTLCCHPKSAAPARRHPESAAAPRRHPVSVAPARCHPESAVADEGSALPSLFPSAKSAQSADSPLRRPTKSPALRAYIYNRDRRRCFYCLRPLSFALEESAKSAQSADSPFESGIGNLELPLPLTCKSVQSVKSADNSFGFTLDHIVPASHGGSDSPLNLVACCSQCNSLKGDTPAAHFLLWLHTRSYLSYREYKSRLRALARIMRLS